MWVALNLGFQTGGRCHGESVCPILFTGSEFAEHFSVLDGPVKIDWDANLTLYRLILWMLFKKDGCSRFTTSATGVMLCAIAESCFGNDVSVALTLPDEDEVLFAEGAGGFIVSVSPDKLDQLSKTRCRSGHVAAGRCGNRQRFTDAEW